MKILFSLFFCALILSCNNTEDKKTNPASSSKESSATRSSSKQETSDKGGMLAQNGDYTSLFNRAAHDCSFISAREFAAAIEIASTSISKAEDDCTYMLTDENGNSTRFRFTVIDWGRKAILKEISTAKDNAEMFGEDSKLSQYRISKTGDTYLSMHQNRMLRILNEAYDTAIILHYQPQISPGANGYDLIGQRKEKALESAYEIANFLLEKHQK